MIRIDLTRQNINHPDRKKRHSARTSCEVGGQRYEVWDDRDPFGRPGGLALTGQARNWARLDKGKLSFGRQAETAADFAPDERKVIAQSAGVVTDLMGRAPPAVGEARTARSHPPDGPEYPQGQDRAPAAFATAPRPEAA